MARVKLMAYTPEPERTVASAARLCYSSVDIEQIQDNLTEEKTADFVRMLSEIGHESPIEHASFTFGIEGVSRSFLAQMTRHRIASYSVQSQRYVKEDQFEYVIPPAIEASERARKLYIETMEQCQRAYNELADILKEENGSASGEAGRKAEKKAIEDARFVLPNACTTKLMVTMNARSLLNFFAHRCCNRAQWEIRDVAEQMLRLVIEVAPNLFKNAGPPCIRGKCPEGRMSCGRMEEMRSRYMAIHTHEGNDE